MVNTLFIPRRGPGRWLVAAGLGLGLLLAGRSAHAQLYNSAGSSLYQGGNMYNTGTFQNAGTYLPATGRFIVAEGDFLVTGAGTIGAGTATVEMRSAATARTLALRGQALPSLELNVPPGTSMTSSGTISTALTLTAGHLLTTNANTLTLAPNAVINGETNAHYVKGRVSQTKSLLGSTPVDFGQMGFTLNPAGQTFPLTVERRTGLGLANVSFGQNPVLPANKGIDRVWALGSASTITTPVTVVLSWLSDNDNGLTFSGINAQVWRSDDNGATWEKQNAAADGTGRSMTITTTRLNALYTVSGLAAPLPVQLTSFAGTLVHDDGLLRWRTASEKNSAYFEVQQSPNGRTAWQALHQVPAAGSSTAAHEYAYTDARISRYGVPVVYYRLRQVDTDGTMAYSSVITLKPVAAEALTLELWPNPVAAAGQLRITAPGTALVTVSVYNVAGRLVFKQVAAPTATLELVSASWATGTYVIRAQQGQQTASQVLVRE
jgi:hypothetical protein